MGGLDGFGLVVKGVEEEEEKTFRPEKGVEAVLEEKEEEKEEEEEGMKRTEVASLGDAG